MGFLHGKLFDAAVAELRVGGVEFDIKHHRVPFFVRPHAPGAGRTLPDEEVVETWGDAADAGDKVDGAPIGTRQARMQRLAASFGVQFDYSVPHSNSLDSHRLVQWAERVAPEKSEKLYKIIGRKLLLEGQRQADHAMLLSAVEEAGLERAAAATLLESDELKSEVRRQYLQAAYGWGVDQTPWMFITCEGEHFTLPGLASQEAIAQVLHSCSRLPPAASSDDRTAWELLNAQTDELHDYAQLEHETFFGDYARWAACNPSAKQSSALRGDCKIDAPPNKGMVGFAL